MRAASVAQEKCKVSTQSVRITEADLKKIDGIVHDHSPWANRHVIHKIALRVGLDRLAEAPELVRELVAEDRARGPHGGAK